MDTKTTEAQKRAKQKYMEKYVEVKVRMTPERREQIKAHAEKHDGGSTTAFINHAIDEKMERDTAAGPDVAQLLEDAENGTT